MRSATHWPAPALWDTLAGDTLLWDGGQGPLLCILFRMCHKIQSNAVVWHLQEDSVPDHHRLKQARWSLHRGIVPPTHGRTTSPALSPTARKALAQCPDGDRQQDLSPCHPDLSPWQLTKEGFCSDHLSWMLWIQCCSFLNAPFSPKYGVSAPKSKSSRRT